MFGIQGQAVFKVNVGSKGDIIDDTEITSFTVSEFAGGGLPSYALTANFRSFEDVKYFHEGNRFDLEFGQSILNWELNSFCITRFSYRVGARGVEVYISGYIDALSYIRSEYVDLGGEERATDRIKSVAASGGWFKEFEELIDYEYRDGELGAVYKEYGSLDMMRWLNCGKTAKGHIEEVWLHSYIPNSVLLLGIDTYSRFRMIDLKTAFRVKKDNPDWVFRNDAPTNVGDKVIGYSGGREIDIKSGLINAFIGYEESVSLEDSEGEIKGEEEVPVEAVLSQSKKRLMAKGITRVPEDRIINDNVHSNYWKAYYSNIKQLAEYSKVTSTVGFGGEYVPIRVLDVVRFYNKNTEGKEGTEYDSGLWIVTGVVRKFGKGGLTTAVMLNRESMGEITEEESLILQGRGASGNVTTAERENKTDNDVVYI